MKRSGLWIAMIALLLVTACGSPVFVYNRLETLVPWYLNRFVDLDRWQRHQARELVSDYLQSHRDEELPHYVELLDKAVELLDGEVSGEDLTGLYGKAEVAAARLQDGVLGWLLVLGAGLSEQQVAEFIDTLRERQAEREEEYLERDDSEYREEIKDSLERNIRRFMGRLDSGQLEILADASNRIIRTDAQWLEGREAMIDDLEHILATREFGWQDQIRELLATRLAQDGMASNPDNAHNVAVIADALAAVLNSRSDRQDRRLRRELDSWRNDLLRLIAQGQ